MIGAIRGLMGQKGQQGKVTVILRIHYYAEFGSSLVAVGPHPAFGKNDVDQALKLHFKEGGYWEGSTEISLALAQPNDRLVYKYVVVWPHKKRYEAVQTIRYASLQGLQDGDVLESHDSFRAPDTNVFVTTCFTDAIFGPHGIPKMDSMLGDKSLGNHWRQRGAFPEGVVAVRFVVLVPRLMHGHTVHITGGHDVVGNWNPDLKIHMLNLGQHLYGCVLYFPREEMDFEYKYAVFDEKDELVFRERGTARHMTPPRNPKTNCLNIDETFEYAHPWKGSGIAVPVFSLRSERSMGVGEFLDLQEMVDWCVLTGNKIIQVLPVNDTGDDPSPYSANSVFALHPIYMRILETAIVAYSGGPTGGSLKRSASNVHRFAHLDKPDLSSVPPELVTEIEAAVQTLNQAPEVEYTDVIRTKLLLLHRIYRDTWQETARSADFRNWWSKNMDWLPAYATWKALLDQTGEWNFTKWSKTVKDVPELIEEKSSLYDKICLHYFVQYHLHLQLKRASDYARDRGISIKGDLPIGVARYSADTWTNPKNFLMDWSAGAPAFMGSAQNWDFPLYDWDAMAEDKYSWWRKRLSHMAQYFQAFRIDHVLGFFRIWAIPAHNWTGMLGHLEPCKPVHISELHSCGVHDMDRITKPYIRWWMLEKAFGNEAAEVAKMFMVDAGSGVFHFKPEFSTVAAIGEALPVSSLPPERAEEGKRNQHWRNELWGLVDNVIAIPSEKNPKTEFYLTCHMYHTSSYHHFGPQEAKDRLAGLWHNFFWERQNWRKEGETRLGALQDAAKMMVCAEDLGAVPPEAYEVLDELGILGLRIQRWPKDGSFGDPARYSYLTVATPSCHDCSTVRGWWTEDRGRCEEFYRTFFGSNPPAQCESWVSRKVVEQHLKSSSMWAIFPIQDLMDMEPALRTKDPLKDAINRPGEKDGCWRYRMPHSIRSLIENTEFTKSLEAMIIALGRASTY
ncbi:4-alpha-glucanotransferase DPE2 [Porphyridium purpureum]|uniref:4-alpha-glucanotransferase n=1 Tax=Porphyridium purpureum TaxID=35688 RepID=A0A5J4Z2H1_PORPP|nr:4-alpha-glucanotransferase DPE2 [Porphyridium purpureum]|eukprot:POR1120..scf295_1